MNQLEGVERAEAQSEGSISSRSPIIGSKMKERSCLTFYNGEVSGRKGV